MSALRVMVGPTFNWILLIAVAGLTVLLVAMHRLAPSWRALRPWKRRPRGYPYNADDDAGPPGPIIRGANDPLLQSVRGLLGLAAWCPAAASTLGLIGTLLGFNGALVGLGAGDAEAAVGPLSNALWSTVFGQLVALGLTLLASLVQFRADCLVVGAMRRNDDLSDALQLAADEDRIPTGIVL